jgi:hypothetical protein
MWYLDISALRMAAGFVGNVYLLIELGFSERLEI